jgi:alpha-glucosidase (family GH31 glycosyl hydrolase)
VDLSNPAAIDWFSRVIETEMLGRNHSGWMADFGEYLPFDAVCGYLYALVRGQLATLYCEAHGSQL